MSEQNFGNHTKWVPAFHFFALPILLFNLIWSTHRCWSAHFSFDSIVSAFTALALFVALFLGRIFALRVQDRVIRLEERLRFQQVLPPDLHPRIDEFKPGQLVALRFARDEELPGLARQVLEQNLTDTKAIKKSIKNWKPDYLRV